MSKKEIAIQLRRIAEALEQLVPPIPPRVNFTLANAFIWNPEDHVFDPVALVAAVDLALLKGVESQRRLLLANTQKFSQKLPANNVLLWGARGMGKSSLVKSVHAALAHETGLKLIEIQREDIDTLPHLLNLVSTVDEQFIVFCDDLSFDESETRYKALKTALEGGLRGQPKNVIFYATSNRRHLIARSMIENEADSAIDPGEVIEDKVSLSDRFGLWIGFHPCSQDDYLEMVFSYASYYNLNAPQDEIRADALEWSITRGGRSGRVAWQYICDLAGRLNISL